MFWNRSKKYLVAYWFKNEKGNGIGQTDITCKYGTFRPGDIIETIKNSQGHKELVLINAIPYKEWKKVS